MVDIPIIVEDLYYHLVTIPYQKDWPDYLGGDPLTVRSLYSFYYGLQMGVRLSSGLDLSPAAESAPPPPGG